MVEGRVAAPLKEVARGIYPRDYVKVPKEDVEAILRAYRNRQDGRIHLGGTMAPEMPNLLEILSRWDDCIFPNDGSTPR